MQRPATMQLSKLIFVSWLILFIGIQLVAPMDVLGSSGVGSAMGTASSIQCAVCRFIPGLTPSQVDMCCEFPRAILLLSGTQKVMRAECRWQFRKELWNCSELDMPLFKETVLPETPEKAFVHALASATVVHRITTACSLGEMGAECGCDYSRNGLLTVNGWHWGSCSDNVSYGVNFAQNFLDVRELDVSPYNTTAISMAMVHLFNNAVGRKVVADNMKLSCRCHGLSGSCAVKTCWRELPSYYQIGDVLKKKYDNAVKVSVSHDEYSPATLYYHDSDRNVDVTPSENSLVYLEKATDYCQHRVNFTRGRQCIPRAIIEAQQREQVKYSSMQEYFPPCEEFCCNGEYQEQSTSVSELCNCRFVWCCDVVCETCTVNMTKYHCTG